jgi:hypothetical protein
MLVADKEVFCYFADRGIDINKIPYTEIREFATWIHFLNRGSNASK